jgi:hypothetical protein|tara:strand:- start:1184 stop:2071 length:888 start_codon:yes stop_codon:yes gene_type:complete
MCVRASVVGLLLLASTAVCAELQFSDFVITAGKFQRILWREFLIEFPNLYTKKDHRIFPTGTVVFYDSEQSPMLLFFANQRIREREEGLVSRISRLNMRSPSGRRFIDITVSDVGQDLQPTPLEELLMGKLPLDLQESALRQKEIAISGETGKGQRMNHLTMKFHLGSRQSGRADIMLNVISGDENILSIREIQNGSSREVTWIVDPSGRRSRHTLRARKVRTDWMHFGSEEYLVDGRERTPAYFQTRFSRYRIEGMIVEYQKYLKSIIQTAICHTGCGEKDEEADGANGNGTET